MLCQAVRPGMNEQVPTLTLTTGAFEKSFKEQIPFYESMSEEDKNTLDHFQKDADAISRLYIRGFVTETVTRKSQQKLMNRIRKELLS